MTVERAEIIPKPLAEPAGVEHQSFALLRGQHGHVAADQFVAGVEHAAGIDRVHEGPLRLLGRHRRGRLHHDGQAAVSVTVVSHVARGGATERRHEIVVFLPPHGGPVVLAKPLGRLDAGVQPDHRPVDVCVFVRRPAQAAVAETLRYQARARRVRLRGGLLAQAADVFEAALELGPHGFEPCLVAGEPRVMCHRPKHEARLLPMSVDEHEATIGFLKTHQVVNPAPRLLRAPQQRGGFEEERTVHDPQAAITRRADLERRQSVLDFARLVDVADTRVEQRLRCGIGNFNPAVRQVRVFPKMDRATPFRLCVKRSASAFRFRALRHHNNQLGLTTGSELAQIPRKRQRAGRRGRMIGIHDGKGRAAGLTRAKFHGIGRGVRRKNPEAAQDRVLVGRTGRGGDGDTQFAIAVAVFDREVEHHRRVAAVFFHEVHAADGLAFDLDFERALPRLRMPAFDQAERDDILASLLDRELKRQRRPLAHHHVPKARRARRVGLRPVSIHTHRMHGADGRLHRLARRHPARTREPTKRLPCSVHQARARVVELERNRCTRFHAQFRRRGSLAGIGNGQTQEIGALRAPFVHRLSLGRIGPCHLP